MYSYFRKVPSMPQMPIPSTISLDSLNGTVSGVVNNVPCSNATPTFTIIILYLLYHGSIKKYVWHTEINMNEFCSIVVNQYVMKVTVSKT